MTFIQKKKKKGYLRLFPAIMKPPMPRVKNKKVHSSPNFTRTDRIQLHHPPSCLTLYIHQECISVEHYRNIIILHIYKCKNQIKIQ